MTDQITFSKLSPEELKKLEAAQSVAPVGADALASSHEAAPSKVGAIFDFLTNLMASGGMGTSGATQGLGGMLRMAKRELTDPENISTLSGAAGGVGGGAAAGSMFGPVGTAVGGVTGAVLGGTLGSRYGEGKAWGPAMQEGAAEGAMEAMGGPAMSVVSKYGFAPLARGATGASLKPARDVLDALIDPATGRQFRTPGEAGRFFRAQATGLMDQVPGTPGRSTYANGLIDLDEGARARKVGVLNELDAKGVTLSTDQLVPPNSFDAMVAALAQRNGNAAAAGPEMERAIQESLARSHPVMPMPPKIRTGPNQGAVQRIPDFQTIPEDMPWKPTEADQRAGGLGEALQDLFSARQKAEMLGNSARPKAAEQAMAVARGKISEGIEGLDPRIAALNQQMHANIPITGAAIDATMPIWGDAMPRVRIAGSLTSPNVQAFDYLRKAVGAVARPSHEIGKGLVKPGAQATAPQLLRLLNALMRGDRE